MTELNLLCGVILAAGQSSRMGTDKALLPWPPGRPASDAAPRQTLLAAAIAALKPVTAAVIVVAGKNARELASVVSACGALLAVNPDPERGQFSSLQVGLREALMRGCDAAMITPVDCPPLRAATLERLRQQFEQLLAAGFWAVEPEYNGRHGHPLVAGRELIDAFLSAPITDNARQVKHAHEQAIQYVPVDEPLLSVDLNTPEQYTALSGAARIRS
jgi:molybdenum cofactor cytidylyltransferase